jgi:hypothetical protein
VVWVFQLVKRNIIWLVLLVVLLPASIPIIKSIFEGLIAFLRYLLGILGV